MKPEIKYRSLILAISLFCFITTEIYAQDSGTKERTRLTLSYEKLGNNDKKLKVSLTAGRGRELQRIEGATIFLSESANDSTYTLAEITTDAHGTSELDIKSGYPFIKDNDGFTSFSATYAGDDHFRKSSSEITIKDVQLELNATEEDSVKSVSVFAYEIDNSGARIPVEGLDINVGVRRLFSILQIGQIQTDADGKGSIEFPNNIPGDSLGMLVVLAKIDDNEYYGTVNSQKTMQWGLPVSYAVKPLPRQLWSNEAPLWMIISVFLVLSAAWFHFVMAIIRVVRVKKATDKTIVVN